MLTHDERSDRASDGRGVGAERVWQSLQHDSEDSTWRNLIIFHASYLFLGGVLLIACLAYLGSVQLDYPSIAALWLAYLFYVSFLEWARRARRPQYDAPLFRYTRILVNLTVVSGLVWASKGESQYFWFFYLLPLFQAIIYFEDVRTWRLILFIIAPYALVAALASWLQNENLNITLLFIDSVFLGLIGFFLLSFFRSAKRSMLQSDEIQVLERTAVLLSQDLAQAELYDVLIANAAQLLRAPIAGVYESDPNDGSAVNVAQIGGRRDIRGTRLARGEGLAGTISENGAGKIVNRYDIWPGRSSKFEYSLFQSAVGVPLKVGDRLLGALCVADDRKHRVFTERDLYLLELLASQAAPAMVEETRRRVEELGRKTERLNLVNELSAAVNSKRNLDEIYDLAIEGTAKVFALKQIGIVVFDNTEGYGRVVRQYQADPDDTAAQVKIPLNNNPSLDWILQYRRPIAIRDVETDPLTVAIRETARLRRIKSILIAPIFVQETLYGTIGFDVLDRARDFTEEEQHLAATIANHVAVAIMNAQQRDHQEQAIRQLSLLEELNTQIAYELRLERILETTLPKALGAIGAQDGSIMLWNDGQKCLEIQTWVVEGQFVRAKPMCKFASGEGIAGHVHETGEPCNCQDVTVDPHYVPLSEKRVLFSQLVVPIYSHRRVIGVISADSPTRAFFTPQHQEFLVNVAGHLAQALEAHELRELENQFATLTFDEQLGRVVDAAARWCDAEASTIVVVDRASQRIVQRAHFPPATLEASRALRTGGLTQTVLSNGKPLVISNAQTNPRVREKDKEEGIVEIACLPLLRYKGVETGQEAQTDGVLFVSSKRPRAFVARQLDLLEHLAALAERVWLNEQRLRRVRAMEFLNRLTLELNGYTQVAPLVQKIVDETVNYFEASGGGLFLLDEDREWLEQVAVSLHEPELLGIKIPASQTADNAVMETRRAHVQHEYSHWEHREPTYEAYNWSVVASAPVAWEEQFDGVLTVRFKSLERVFTQDEFDLLVLIGNLASVAIKNAQQHSEAQRLLRGAVHAIIAIDEGGRIREYNQRAQELLGYSREEALGKPVQDFYVDPDNARMVGRLLHRLPHRPLKDYITTLCARDGSHVKVRLSATLMEDDWGKPNGSMGFFRPLDEYEGLERQVRQMREFLSATYNVSTGEGLHDMLFPICEQAKAVLPGVDSVILYAFNPASQSFASEPVTAGEISHPGYLVNDFKSPSAVRRLIAGAAPCYVESGILKHPILSGGFVEREGIASAAAMLVKSGNKTLGAIFFNYRKPHEFTQDEKDLMEMFAALSSLAIQNALAVFESGTLRKIGELLNRTTELDETINLVVHGMIELTGANEVCIVFYDKEKNQFTPDALTITGRNDDVHSYVSTVRPGGLTFQIIRTLEPMFIPDTRAIKDINPTMSNKERAATAGLPLIGLEGVIGVLYAHWLQPHECSDHEKALLRTLANQAAVAIENARQYQELEIKGEIAKTTTSVTGLDAVLEHAAKAIANYYPLVGIRLVDPKTQRLKVRPCYLGDYAEFANNSDIEWGSGITGWVAKEGKPYISGNVLEEPLYIRGNVKTRSEVCVPIWQDGQVIGVVNVESEELNLFHFQDVKLLEEVARQLSELITKAELGEKEQAHRREQEAIYRITTWANSNLGLSEILEQVLNEMIKLFRVDQGGVVEFYTDRGYGQVIAQVPYHHDPAKTVTLHGNPSMEHILEHKKPLAIFDVANDPLVKRVREEGALVNSASTLLVPLFFKENLFGTIGLDALVPRDFSSHDIELADSIARQVSGAIERRRTLDDLAQREGHLRAVYEVGKATLGTLNRQEMYERFLRHAVDHINPIQGHKASFATLQEYDGEKQELVLVAAYCPNPELNRHFSIGRRAVLRGGGSLGRIGLTGRAVLDARSVLADDVADCERFPDYISFDSATRSELAVPVKQNGQVIAVLNLEHPEPRAFDEYDCDALECFADLVGVALQNSDQSEKLSRAQGLLGISIWEAELSHEIERGVSMIRRRVFDCKKFSPPDRVIELLNDIDKYADQLRLPALPELVEQEELPVRRESSDLGMVLHQEVANYEQIWPDIRFEIEGSRETVHIAIHPLWLKRIIRHLVRNAAENLPADSPTRCIWLRKSAAERYADLCIEDSGRGIPREMESYLFKEPMPRRGRRGRGLFITSHIVNYHGGKIWKQDFNDRSGTSIWVRLPRVSEGAIDG